MRLAAIIAGGVWAEQVTPLAKVTLMLQEMLTKTAKEKHDDVVAFSTFKQWCDDTMGSKKRALEDEKATIEKLTASIEKGEAALSHLTEELQRLNEDIDSWKGDKKAAAGIRKKESKDYKAAHEEYNESIDALDRAIAMLKKLQYEKSKKGDALVQVKSIPRLPASAHDALDAFLQSTSAQEPNAYDFQGGSIIEMLEKLRHKFQDERHALEKAEMKEKHSYEKTSQALADNIEQGEEEVETKSVDKQKTARKKADEEGDLQRTKGMLEEDSAYLQDTVNMCSSKAEAFEQRQTTRSGEMEAVKKAIEILSSDAVKGAADKHLPKLLQMHGKKLGKQRHVLLQLRSSQQGAELVAQVATFLQHRANDLGSRALALAATHAAEDPFKKVKKMIEGLITKLLEEANAEAEQHGWCSTELATNTQTREEKTSQVEKLSAEVEERTAKSMKLKDTLSKIADGLRGLDQAMAEATEQRRTEKAKNKQTIDEAREAQKAVAQAIEVLKSFYAQAAASTEFTQGPEDDAPEFSGEKSAGNQAGGGGVVAMLEVVLSDFARLESETHTEESTAAQEYEHFMSDSKEDKAVKGMDQETYEQEQERNEQNLHSAKKDLEAAQGELAAATDYYEKLKPDCVETGVSYEERVQKRQEEIKSLKEALQILGGEALS
mmetsp:Transcript_40690/g.97598  ORF Transcript_40690/g.97598 Transcript_40690/m.97598 type:complete len:663 (+) Transcript_40690:94-2082(+)